MKKVLPHVNVRSLEQRAGNAHDQSEQTLRCDRGFECDHIKNNLKREFDHNKKNLKRTVKRKEIKIHYNTRMTDKLIEVYGQTS